MLSADHLNSEPQVRSLRLNTHPNLACLEDCLRGILSGQSTAINISWIEQINNYSISLTHNRSHSEHCIAEWKIFQRTNYQCKLIWKYQTNNVLLIHNLLMDPTGLQSLALRTAVTLTTREDYLELVEQQSVPQQNIGQQNIESIGNRLRDNLRKFLTSMQNVPNSEQHAI